MWLKWLPWRFLIRRLAKEHGFIDPLVLLARLRGFAQPSEVAEPIELLRAGVVFHARGLINSRVIQHNLDWVWPFWVERQFDPLGPSFVPRAFSITQVNLTHRNWTAVGVPDETPLPVVDPRGLTTPFFDGWSLDCWIIEGDGKSLLPSRAKNSRQRLLFENGLTVASTHQEDGLVLETKTTAVRGDKGLTCRLEASAKSSLGGWLAVSLRPCNPEGVSLVHEIELSRDGTVWNIDDKPAVLFGEPVERCCFSNYRAGDVFIRLGDREEKSAVCCEVGLASAAALFKLEPDKQRRLHVDTPLTPAPSSVRSKHQESSGKAWSNALEDACRLEIPEPGFQFLYDAALRTLALHSPGEIFPGPYTYKRFWFRDAAFIIYALLCAGLVARAERALDKFPERQTNRGYFHSQAGEWDSNGQALWIMRRFGEITGQPPKPRWQRAIERGAAWINRKRLPTNLKARHAGLLPAGFSAEHLGPNDYYYWDDFWAVAGLRAAGKAAEALGKVAAAAKLLEQAEEFMALLEKNLDRAAHRRGRLAMPASPYRRLDAGAIGSLAAGYPLRLFSPKDPRLLDTVDFLLDNCLVHGGFFQDMIHSGINVYLTLHIAQVLLRAEDPRYLALFESSAKAASPTGQWPEAIHPATGGGCMGDGQHVWAAAEWLLMIRNCFIREEGEGLILGSGIAKTWLDKGDSLYFGPAPTSFGAVSMDVRRTNSNGGGISVSWQGSWRRGQPSIEIRIPGFKPVVVDGDQQSAVVEAERRT